MKKYLSVTIICSLIFTLISCASSVRLPKTELLRSPFQCELGWHTDGYDFRATIVKESESFSLTMLYPPETVGLSMSGTQGELLSYVNGKAVGKAPRFYMYISELFLTDSPFDFLSSTAIGGAEFLCYSRDKATWYFSTDDGRPKRVDIGSDVFEIIWIEGIQDLNENTDADR
jgi:hypothetical protein